MLQAGGNRGTCSPDTGSLSESPYCSVRLWSGSASPCSGPLHCDLGVARPGQTLLTTEAVTPKHAPISIPRRGHRTLSSNTVSEVRSAWALQRLYTRPSKSTAVGRLWIPYGQYAEIRGHVSTSRPPITTGPHAPSPRNQDTCQLHTVQSLRSPPFEPVLDICQSLDQVIEEVSPLYLRSCLSTTHQRCVSPSFTGIGRPFTHSQRLLQA